MHDLCRPVRAVLCNIQHQHCFSEIQVHGDLYLKDATGVAEHRAVDSCARETVSSCPQLLVKLANGLCIAKISPQT